MCCQCCGRNAEVLFLLNAFACLYCCPITFSKLASAQRRGPLPTTFNLVNPQPAASAGLCMLFAPSFTLTRSRGGTSAGQGLLKGAWRATPFDEAVAARHSPLGMVQKSIDAFFKAPAGSAKQDITTAAANSSDGGERASAEGAAGAGAAAVPLSQAAAAATQPPAGEAIGEVQASEEQRMRAHANRNAALAKQVATQPCA